MTRCKHHYDIKPKKKHYSNLEVDEFWTFVGSKENKKWLIYAYDRESGEIVAYVWGDRNAKTAKRLREKLKQLQLTKSRHALEHHLKTLAQYFAYVGDYHESVFVNGGHQVF